VQQDFQADHLDIAAIRVPAFRNMQTTRHTLRNNGLPLYLRQHLKSPGDTAENNEAALDPRQSGAKVLGR
jgi:hypothetical protein